MDGVEACQVQMRAKAVIDYLQRMVELPMDLSEDSKRHISPPRQEDYKKVNKTYHEAALIQLRLRICQSPPSTEDVQKRVESILSLLSQVTLLDGSCPGTVMLFPLFWTGCGAISALQQGKVRTLLKKMVERYRLANASNSLRVLEDLWERRLQDELGDSKMPRQENCKCPTDGIFTFESGPQLTTECRGGGLDPVLKLSHIPECAPIMIRETNTQ